MNTLQLREGDVPVLRAALLKVLMVTVVLLALGWALRSGAVHTDQAIPLLMLIAAAGFLLYGHGHHWDLMNPMRIFGVMWCTCAGLASLRWLPVLTEWSTAMWQAVLLGFSGFALGYVIFPGRVQASTRTRTMDDIPKNKLLPYRATVIIAGICLLIGVLALANGYIKMGEIPIFAENVDAARMRLNGVAGQRDPELDTWFNKIVFLFVLYCRYCVFLSFIALFTVANTWKRRLLCALLIAAGMFAYGSQGGRGLVFDLAVVGVVLFHYLKRRIKLKEAVCVAVVLVMFVGMAGYYRIKATGFAPTLERAMEENGIADNPLAGAAAVGYVSATISFEVLNRLTEDLPYVEQAHGHLFYFANKLIPRENLNEISFNLYSGEMITPTFLGEFYADYGLPGVFIGPFVLGLAYAWVYARAMRYRSLYMLFALAMMVQIIVYFPYVNLFSQYLTWIWDLLSMALLWRAILWLESVLPNRSPGAEPALA